MGLFCMFVKYPTRGVKLPITRGPSFARGLTIRNGFAYIGLPHVHRPQRTRNHQVRYTRGLSGRTGTAVGVERGSRGYNRVYVGCAQ